MTLTVLEHPSGRLEAFEDRTGRLRLKFIPARPKIFIAQPEIETSYPLALVRAIANVKNPAWVCDEISRDESGYVLRKIKANVEGYRIALRPTRILDFGCGCGASLVALSRIWPRAGLTGVELDPASLGIAQARVGHYGLTKVNLFPSTGPACLPAGLGEFDLINLNAVIEHLLPEERKNLLPQLWATLKPGGFLLVSETPYRFCLFEAHTTGLPLINFLPDFAVQQLAGRFSKRVEPKESWPALLRKGIRGATVREVLAGLDASPHGSLLAKPRSAGIRRGFEEWPASMREQSNCYRFSTMGNWIALMDRALRKLSRVTRLPLAAELSLAIQKIS